MKKTIVKIILGFVISTIIAFIAKLAWKTLELSHEFLIIIFGFIILENLIYFFYTHPEDQKRLEKNIGDKLNNIVKYAALFTENGAFEKTIAQLDKVELGNSKWLLAKFISDKLSKDFRMGTVIKDVGSRQYLELAEKLIAESRGSIYLTCPFTPYKWFEKFAPTDSKILDDVCQGRHTSIEKFPHLVALRNNRFIKKKDKRRLMLLDENEWKYMTSGEASQGSISKKHAFNVFKEFIRLNEASDITLSFLCIDYLDSNDKEKLSVLDLKDTDYGIYENQILINWRDTEGGVGKVSLCTDLSNYEELCKLFNFNDLKLKPYHKTVKDIQRLFQEGKKKIFPKYKPISELYPAELYDKAIEKCHPGYQEMHNVMLRIIKDQSTRKVDLRILEIGAGTGILTRKVATQFPNTKIIALEPDKTWWEYLKISSNSERFPNIQILDYKEGDILKFKLNKKFDIILMSFSFHHIPYSHQKIAIQIIKDMLSEKGVVVIGEELIPDFKFTELESCCNAHRVYHGYVITWEENKYIETNELLFRDAAAIEAEALCEGTRQLPNSRGRGESKNSLLQFEKLIIDKNLNIIEKGHIFPTKIDENLVQKAIDMFNSGKTLVKQDNEHWNLKDGCHLQEGEAIIEAIEGENSTRLSDFFMQQCLVPYYKQWGIFVYTLGTRQNE